MANEVRSGRGVVNNDESSSSKEKKITTGLSTPDASSLRKSGREMLLKENLCVRKSERLEKRSPTTSPINGKSERIEKKCTPSPLRRSERGKNNSYPSSESKKSDKRLSSSSMKRKKMKKQKSVRQLTLGTGEVSKNEKRGLNPMQMRRKTGNVRAFRSNFNKHNVKPSDCGGKKDREPKFSPGDGRKSEDEVNVVDECNERNMEATMVGECNERSMEATVCNEKSVEATSSNLSSSSREEADEIEDSGCVSDQMGSPRSSESEMPYDTLTLESNEECGETPVDCFLTDILKEPELVDSSSRRTTEGQICLKSTPEIIPSRRKMNTLNVDCESFGVDASKDICASNADAISSLPSECTRSGSFKRQRVDHDSIRQEFSHNNTNLNVESGVASSTKQKESHLQTGAADNTCDRCNLGGKLLSCDGRGCQRSYHLSCLYPPMDDVPLGVWYCFLCVKKKLELGVHSVSKGVESIWDAKEVEIDGQRKQKEFFVKYKGLAHIHNRWVPESKLLLDAPSLVAKFNRTNQVARWKKEWTVPHRLLQKRMLMSNEEHDLYLSEHAGDKLDCHCEWLVKWCGLGYEHATWELENTPLFNSRDGQGLIRDYDNRCNKVPGSEKCSYVKLSQGQSSAYANNVEYINKLCDFLQRGQNAVFIDEQERITKMIQLIQAFYSVSDTCRPFLIISTSAALGCWDDEFLRLAPSVNVVVYNGNKDLRRSIRKLEFHNGRGCVIFQALITTLAILTEDLDVLKSIGWELILIDESQNVRFSSHCSDIKLLDAKMRLLIVSSQIKESASEYQNLLSLLVSCGDSNLTYSSDSVSNLKEKLSKYIIYGKLESSRSEYWVPVRISNVQLEEYCAALISKSEFLCSPLNLDNGRVLKDVLKSNRKCCDHPFLVNKDLAKLLRDKLSLEPIDFLGVDIEASGKFHLLKMMLSEIKQRGLRVLILFQSMGSSGSKSNTIGDLLEDFMRQKYGLDSYERLEGIVPQSSKKQEILNNFNNRERGRFVFLIDARACLSSVKLSSVDGAIIFGSDWNPASDVRSLRRVTFDSPFDQIPIFRLYSSNTLEEKVLILAKQGKSFNSLENMTWSTCHMLLKWGVSHQFQNLDKFHGGNVTASRTNIFSEEPYWEDVMQEFSHILSNGKVSGSRSSSIILNVQQVGAAYHVDSSLLGELQNEIVDEGQPCLFWTKLLEGRYPQWKYISTSSQRTRKRAQFFDGSSKCQEFESEEVVKKRKKVVNSSVDLPSVKFVSEGKKVAGHKERAFGTSVDNRFHSSPRSTYGMNVEIPANSGSTSPCLSNLKIPEADIFVSEERKKLLNEQKSLHLLLKPDMLKLCKILKLSDDVQNWVEKFLEYVLNNHPVAREPATSLQSFQISLCWTVASWRKLKIDFKESLDQANQHLNFNCDKDDAELIYYMLRCLKRLFSDHVKGNSSNVSNKQKLRVPVEDSLINQEYSDRMVPSQSSLALDFKLAEIDVEKIIIKIKKKYQKLLNKLLQKLLELKNEIKQTFEIEKEDLERRKGARISVIRSCFENNAARRTDQLKLVDSSFAKEIEELELEKDKRLKSLEEEEQTTRNKMQEKETMIVEGVKTWAYAELLRKPHGGTVYLLGCSQTNKPIRDQDGPVNINPPSDNILDNQSPDKVVCKVGVGVGLSAASEAVICSHSVSRTPQDQAISGNEELDNLASDQEHVTNLSPHPKEQTPERPKSVSLGNNAHYIVSTKSLCQEVSRDEATLIVPNGEVPLEMPENVRSSNDNDQEEFRPLSLPCSEQNHDEIASRTFDSEVPLGSQATACSNDGEDNLVTVHLPSPEEQNCVTNEAEEGAPLGVPVTIGSSDHLQSFVSEDQPSSQKQIPDTDVVQMTDGDMQLREPVTVCFSDSGVNVISVNQESSEGQIAERATLSVPDGENAEMCTVTSNGIDVNEQDGMASSNHGEMCTAASNGTIDVNEQDGRAASNHNSLCLEPSLVNSSCVQPATSLARGDPMPINQAQQDEHSLEPQMVEATLSRHLDHVAQIFEPGMQMNLPPCSNAPDLPLVDGTGNQLNNIGHTTNQGSQASVELSGNPLELSNQAGTQLQPNSESADVSHASVRLVENLPQLLNQLPPVTSSSLNLPLDIATVTTGLQFSDVRVPFVASEFNNGHIQSASASAVPSWVPPPLHPDPLETEVQRLSKEIEKFSQIHEETKLRLKSDRDNEIAQLVRKYEIKEQEIEAEFLLKKKELDENKNKVMNNKYLADAFRSKCMEARTQTRSAVQQDSAGFTQLRYLQQALQQQQNAQRATAVASSSLASSPAANLQTTQPASGIGERASCSHLGSYSIPNPPTRPPPQTHTLPTRPPPQTQNLPTGPQPQTQNPPARPPPETTAPPTRPSTQTSTPPTRPLTQSNIPPTRPPTQTHTPPAQPPTQTHTPTARPPTQTNTPPARPPQINTTPTRPPQINTPPTRPPQINTSSPGLFQGAGSIRAPAPHLGRFRPPTSTTSLPPHPTPSLQPHPSVMPMQQSNSMASTTNALPTLPPQQPPNTSQPDAANSDDQLQTALGGLPDSIPNVQLNSSAPGPMQVSPVSTDLSANVVYLSDDD